MTLTKEQRLDWLTYMYFLFISNSIDSFYQIWFIEEKGELSGFPYQSYVTYAQFPELQKFGRVTSYTIVQAIHLCEQAKK